MNELAGKALKPITYGFDVYLRELPMLQTFSLVIIGVLLFFVILMMIRANTVGGKRDKFIDKWGLADMSKVKVRRAWNEIVQEIESGNGTAMKKAINDADKILGEALKEKGFKGKTLDERLNQVDGEQLENIKEVWQAHRLSERIKKEPTLVLSQHEVNDVIAIYRKAFKDFELFK